MEYTTTTILEMKKWADIVEMICFELFQKSAINREETLFLFINVTLRATSSYICRSGETPSNGARKKKTKIIDINLCLTKDNYTFGYFPFNRFSCQNSTLPLRAHLLYFSPKAPELDILAILLQKPLHTSTIQFPL